MKQQLMRFLIVSILSVCGVFAQPLSFNTTTSTKALPLTYKKEKRYTIQLITTQTLQQAQKSVQNLPKNYKEKTHFYKVGSYVAARYSHATHTKQLKPLLQEIHKLGFKDAYIVQTTKWHMLGNRLDKTTSNTQQNSSKEVPKLSKYNYSKTLLKADKAFKEGDDTTALLYYELLYHTNPNSQQIKTNLCYLYGKQGAWDEAQEIIKKQRFANPLIYAYAYGAYQSNQESFLSDLADAIILDKTAQLALLSAAYFEARKEYAKALQYFQLAYTKNPSDPYNIFAFARSLDISKNYTLAIKLYKKVVDKINQNHPLYPIAEKRLQTLQRIQ